MQRQIISVNGGTADNCKKCLSWTKQRRDTQTVSQFKAANCCSLWTHMAALCNSPKQKAFTVISGHVMFLRNKRDSAIQILQPKLFMP